MSSMDTHKIFQPSNKDLKNTHVSSMEQYHSLYKESIESPEKFWYDIACKDFYWEKKPDPNQILDYNFDCKVGPIYVKWFDKARTNLCYNAIDRHIENGLGDKVAYYWEGNDPSDKMRITYSDLHEQVQRLANVLKSKGLKKGDRVVIYMPMIPELVVSLLACSRIGLMHSVVFGGFSADALADRIVNAQCHTILTCDGVWRGSKLINLKSIVDHAMNICAERDVTVTFCLVVRHVHSAPFTTEMMDQTAHNFTEARQTSLSSFKSTNKSQPGCRPLVPFDGNTSISFPILMQDQRDFWWHEEMAKVTNNCPIVWMEAEDPLFMLYTSGSTGKPKGVVHTTAGYMVYAATTFKMTFDYREESDIYFCTADIGWITGHSYVVYGPLCNAATSVLFEGTPYWPDFGRCWEIIDHYSVSIFYTAPTALRSMLRAGDSFVKKSNRTTLRVLGTVGEPINPEVWLWYYHTVGESRCAVVDTFWQTETGGHTITPLAGCTPCKPGSACLAFFGVCPELLSEVEGGRSNDEEMSNHTQHTHVLLPPHQEGEGYLVFSRPWPGIMRTVYNDHKRFETTYFRKFPGYYCTGDGARRDEDGYYWITGRIDDMLNVSGHLLSTAEIESALVEHPMVAEAAVVARAHEIKGECTYCFVTLKDNCPFTNDLVKELTERVREKIGPFAAPDFIQEAPALPKTRSGKIMRRILREIAINGHKLGDISTLADSSVLDVLYALRPPNA